MEEEKKAEGCRGKEHHHKCCGHKLPKLLLLIGITFFIFTLGFLTGSCGNRRGGADFYNRGFGMMGEGKNNYQNGACRFSQEQTFSQGCPMRKDLNRETDFVCPLQNQALPTPLTTTTPLK